MYIRILHSLIRRRPIMADLIAGIVGKLVHSISPALKESMLALVTEWKGKAAETKSPWDDLFCDLLIGILK